MPKGIYKRTEEMKKSMSNARKGKKRKPFSEETLKKLSLAKRGNQYSLGAIRSTETRKKMSKAKKGKKPKNFSVMQKKAWERNRGKKRAKETKEKMRLARFEYIKKTLGIAYPVIGKHEKQILDNLEKKLGHMIIRQFKCGGYHLDGYIPEINLAIEVDEKAHENKKEKDIMREEFIKAKLGCQFLRIKDYD